MWMVSLSMGVFVLYMHVWPSFVCVGVSVYGCVCVVLIRSKMVPVFHFRYPFTIIVGDTQIMAFKNS